MKKALAVLAATGLMASFAGSASAKPVTAFTDVAGDSGFADNPGMPGTAEAGFDLTAGTIDKVGKDLVFTVTHSAMPATNQPGEVFRFLWHFDVGDKQYRFYAERSLTPNTIIDAATMGVVYKVPR